MSRLYHFTKPDLLLAAIQTSDRILPNIFTRNYDLSRDVIHKLNKGVFGINDGYSVRLNLDQQRMSSTFKLIDVDNLNDESITFLAWDDLFEYVDAVDFARHKNLSHGIHKLLLTNLHGLNIGSSMDLKWYKNDDYDQLTYANQDAYVLAFSKTN